MNNYRVQYKTIGTRNHVTAIILDKHNNVVYDELGYFVGMVHSGSVDRYINKIVMYTFDAAIDQPKISEQDLINDYAIRGISGKPGMLEFVNYNIDEDIEEISKEDLLDIFHQWKKILDEQKK